MKQLRNWCAVFYVWLFVLYNIERLYKPMNLASFVYVLAAATAIPILIFPQLQRLSPVFLFGLLTPVTLGLKAWLGYGIGGIYLPITITEIGAIWVTAALAMKLGRSLEDLRAAALAALLAHLPHRTQSFEQGQAEIYREVSRARKHCRPLALMAISVAEKSIDLSLDRFTEELQQECVRNYVYARTAELLSREMKDCDFISQQDRQFVTVLPEADRAKVRELAEKLKRTAREKLGVELCVGVSLFPDEEVTFVHLLERAQSQLTAAEERQDHTNSVRATDRWNQSVSEFQQFAEPQIHSFQSCDPVYDSETTSIASVEQER